jgi:hypothetical protein
VPCRVGLSHELGSHEQVKDYLVHAAAGPVQMRFRRIRQFGGGESGSESEGGGGF